MADQNKRSQQIKALVKPGGQRARDNYYYKAIKIVHRRNVPYSGINIHRCILAH